VDPSHPRATHARYQTDLTDAEWALIASFLPLAYPVGRPRAWPAREIINAIFYVLRGGIAWRLLPTDFPPWQTVYGLALGKWRALLKQRGAFHGQAAATVREGICGRSRSVG
jgi:transposase